MTAVAPAADLPARGDPAPPANALADPIVSQRHCSAFCETRREEAGNGRETDHIEQASPRGRDRELERLEELLAAVRRRYSN